MLIILVFLILFVFYGFTLNKDNNLNISEKNVAETGEVSGNITSKLAFDNSKFTSWIVSSKESEIVIMFDEMQDVNALLLNENGFNVTKFSIYYNDGNEWKLCYRQNEIGLNRLATFYTVKAKGIKIVIDDFKNIANINDIKIYCLEQKEQDLRVTSYITGDSLENYDPITGIAGKVDSKAFDVITDVQYFLFGHFTADGKIEESENAGNLNVLKEMIGNRDVDIRITIGTPNDIMGDMLRNHMDESINSVVNIVNEQDVAGVDFDWEFPQGKEEYSLYSEFIVKLSEKLHENGKSLSLALAPWELNFSQEAVKAIDQVQIMAYDLFDHNGDNNSYAGSCESNIQYMLSQGFTLEQLNLGISYYGRPSDASSVWVDYNNPDYVVDEYIMAPNGVYFNTATTVRDKTVYSILRGVGGLMVFRQDEDLLMSDPLSLTAQIGNARDAFSKEDNNDK